MSTNLQAYLTQRYLNLSHNNIGDLMETSYTENESGILQNTFNDNRDGFNSESLTKEIHGVDFWDAVNGDVGTPINHAIFAQNIIDEVSSGNFDKSANLLISSIRSESNSNYIFYEELLSLFRKTQGLVEVPISLVLQIGAKYDAYYYGSKDESINFSKINGLFGVNNLDIFDNDDVSFRHYGSYGYNQKNLSVATIPFLRPITPKSIEDKMVFGFENYTTTNTVKNYRESFYNFETKRNESISNNISSHIPVSGYGVLNNYLNAMSKLYFGIGLDGGDVNETANDNSVPYHIIGNYNGRLKTIKTYNDQNINFMASYNSYNPNIKHDLSNIVDDFNTLSSSITFDDDFIFTNKYSVKKIEFFLILSKIKVNFLGGHITSSGVYNSIINLCGVNNLGAKELDSFDLPDFVALLLYSMYPPDGAEPDEGLNRLNKNTKVLSKYYVDPNSFIGISTETPSINNDGFSLQKEIIRLNGEYTNLPNIVSELLIDIWSKEFKTDSSQKLSKLDKKGTFMLYPSSGGGIEINNLLTNSNKVTDDRSLYQNSPQINYKYSKTNIVSTEITPNDLSTSTYLNSLKYDDNNFTNYSRVVLNDILLNKDISDFYSKYENAYNLITTLTTVDKTIDKFSGTKTIPVNITENDTALLYKFNPVYFKPQSYLTDTKSINYFDRYDDVHIIANTTNPDGVHKLKFDNRTLILNTSRLFWFDTPKEDIITVPEYITYNTKKSNGGYQYNLNVDVFEFTHYIYDVNIYPNVFKDDIKKGFINHHGRELIYNEFTPGKSLYVENGLEDPKEDYTDYVQRYDNTVKPLIDIFDVDKLEDFRSLYKQFSGASTGSYFSDTFNTFNFKNLIKHLNIVGYKDLPNNLSIDGRNFSKDEIATLLNGYTGHFIEFASITGLNRLINTALTIGQQNKATLVIDEFLNDKITVNNYSIAGPLDVQNTRNNPTGIKINTFPFNPIIAYASQNKSYEDIVGPVGDILLFRTILFGDQMIKPYNPIITDPLGIDGLINKYVYSKDLEGYVNNPLISTKEIVTELTRYFFSRLNIELNLGNLKLLVSYLRSYLMKTLVDNGMITEDTPNYGFHRNRNLASDRGYEGDRDTILDGKSGIYGTTSIIAEIVNGVYTPTGYEPTYTINKFEDLNMGDNFDTWIKGFNKDTVDKTLKLIDSSIEHFDKLNLDAVNEITGSNTPTTNNNNDSFEPGDVDQKGGTYYRIKSLYDKNVSFKNIDLTKTHLLKGSSEELGSVDVNEILNTPLFYNFNVQESDFCEDSDTFTEDKVDGRLKDLYDYASILDRGNNDYGTKVIVDIASLGQMIGEDINKLVDVDKYTSKSMWTVLSKLASDHEFLLHPLTSYINLNGTTKNDQSPYELAHDMFGVFKDLVMWDSNPAFIFQLGSLTSDIDRKGAKKKGFNQSFDPSSTFCLDVATNQLGIDGEGRLLDENVPADIKNSKVTSFVVDFANPNQNMFQNIQISTDEFVNTEESIKTAVSLTDSSQRAVLSTGKLFSAMESRSYSCTVTSLGNATIQPLSYFYLRNVPLFYGTYWITNVSHKITANNMVTTFKGVRQPIARKPTANGTVIKNLIRTALAQAAESGFLDREDLTPARTQGEIYSDRGN